MPISGPAVPCLADALRRLEQSGDAHQAYDFVRRRPAIPTQHGPRSNSLRADHFVRYKLREPADRLAATRATAAWAELVNSPHRKIRRYPESVEKNRIPAPNLKSDGATLDELAASQGVSPVTDFDSLLGHASSEDESLDEFSAMLRVWRSEGSTTTE